MHILIVDDSKAMQNIIVRTMKTIGFSNDVFEFSADGEDALQKIRTNPPDLVLCDLHMPKISRIDVIETILREKLPVKAGIVSIERAPSYRKQALAAGARFYLQKPFTGEQLFNVLVDVIGQNPLTRTGIVCNQSELTLPDCRLVQEMLTDLAQSDVPVSVSDYRFIDYSRTPFIVVGYIDGQKVLRAYLVFDCVAANCLATLMGFISVQQALDSIAAKQVNEQAMRALHIPFGLLRFLIRSSIPDDCLSLSGINQSQAPSGHLKNVLDAKVDHMLALSIGHPEPRLMDGKMLLCLN